MSLINEIDAIDFVTTNNELEAILLENNLIKTNQPRYNILLRDDKSYPYIKVTMSEDYPRVVFTRRLDRKKGDLFYGPFFAGTARRLLKLVADQFKLRSCDLDIVDRQERAAAALPLLRHAPMPRAVRRRADHAGRCIARWSTTSSSSSAASRRSCRTG